MTADEQRVADVLRCAGARFALVHGSRAPGSGRPDSDLDVGAWWGARPPVSWEVNLPPGVDLVVLDTAPLWLSGRIAQEGRLLFDDDPRARGPVAGGYPAALPGRDPGDPRALPPAADRVGPSSAGWLIRSGSTGCSTASRPT
ncbi:MAG: nucleotidyltransferase domain-containing protein [Pseudonocardiaceae bacterium]